MLEHHEYSIERLVKVKEEPLKRSFVALLAIAALTGAACGSDAGHTGHSGGGHHASGSMDHTGAVPGGPADPSQAERQILVAASDKLRFDPASIDVSAGEIVTFVVRNDGDTDHEFVLGDEGYQKEHEADMQEAHHHMAAMDNGVAVAPGETEELTWRFEESGELLYGCHEPGHYEGGMVGTINVR